MLLVFLFVSFSNGSVDLCRISTGLKICQECVLFAVNLCSSVPHVTEVVTLCVANECNMSEDYTSLERDAVSMDKQ
jgi:hypothetical protein